MEKDLALRNTFNKVARLYDKIRPDYPEALFDELTDKTELDKNSKLLEIGAGTGQATLPLAKRGYNIIVIELGDQLTKILRKNFNNYPNVQVLKGAFEDIELPLESFDLVYVATAFHWIKPEVKFIKPYQILKPSSYLAIIKGDQILDEAGDHFFHASQPIYNKYWPSNLDNPYRLRRLSEVMAADLDINLFTLTYFKCFPRAIPYTADEYCQLLNTDSEKLALPDNKRQKFLNEVKELINRKFDGTVKRHYANSLTIARKTA